MMSESVSKREWYILWKRDIPKLISYHLSTKIVSVHDTLSTWYLGVWIVEQGDVN